MVQDYAIKTLSAILFIVMMNTINIYFGNIIVLDKCLVFGGLVKLVKTGALQASGRSSNLLLITNRQTSALNLAGSASEPWLRLRMLLYSIA